MHTERGREGEREGGRERERENVIFDRTLVLALVLKLY
jgi:hypothetical protein